MKFPPAILFVLATLPVAAADPQAFAPEPFRLELPRPCGAVASMAVLLPSGPLRVDYCPSVQPFLSRLDVPLPVGTVLIDYGTPLKAEAVFKGSSNLDAPGAGYREQRARSLDDSRRR